MGEFAYGEGDDTLESALGARLKKRRLTLAAAESCTGGLLGARVTAVPGSSSYFVGGIVSYANAVKTRSLGVPGRLLKKHGAVSPECAAAMARGARRALDADIGVSITGVAGPDGGTKEKPVGLVFVAVSGPGRAETVKKLEINGPREAVRSRAVTAALRLVYDAAARLDKDLAAEDWEAMDKLVRRQTTAGALSEYTSPREAKKHLLRPHK